MQTQPKGRLLLLLLLLLLTTAAWAQQSQDQLNYIKKYHEIAMQEMERAGIPASIKLAQGILESDSGNSYLAKRANNHFGVKCGNDWEGKKVYREDDDYDDKGKIIESCFRGYETAEASYIAHSEFLRDPRKTFRYGFLFQLDPKDYRRWANGLKQAGYATSATYPERLISLIERYELYKYDDLPVLDIETPDDIVASSGILKTNDVRYTVTASTETVDELARRTDISVGNLIKYNEHLRTGNQPLEQGTQVYLQKKRTSYRGQQTYHVVEPGETMFDVSQRYGIRLDKLYTRNRMVPGTQAATNERIKIRGGKVSSPPRLRTKDDKEPAPILPPTNGGKLEMEDDDAIYIDDKPIVRPGTPSTRPPTPAPTPGNPNSGQVIIVDRNSGDTTIVRPPVIRPTPPPTTMAPPPRVEDKEPTLNEDIFGSGTTPPPTLNPYPTPSTPTPPAPNAVQTYKVQKGDTLYSISRRFNTEVETLKRLNSLTSNDLNIGQEIRVR